MARRVQYGRHGDSSVLQLVTDQPVPARKAGQVLIDNRATSVNPVDYKVGRSSHRGVLHACHPAVWLPGCPDAHLQVILLSRSSTVIPFSLPQLREGMGGLAGPRLPAVPGGDVSGVVLEADAGSAFKTGGRAAAVASPAWLRAPAVY